MTKSASNADNLIIISSLYPLQILFSDEASSDMAAAGLKHHFDILCLNKLTSHHYMVSITCAMSTSEGPDGQQNLQLTFILFNFSSSRTTAAGCSELCCNISAH